MSAVSGAWGARSRTGRGLAAAASLLCVVGLPFRLCGQWTGGPTGPVYYSGGNVGIATNNPLVRLQVQQTTDAPTYGLAVVNSAITRSTFLWTDAANISHLDGGASGTGFLVLNIGGGNVGIGTIAPQYLLSVNGTIGTKEVIVTNVVSNK